MLIDLSNMTMEELVETRSNLVEMYLDAVFDEMEDLESDNTNSSIIDENIQNIDNHLINVFIDEIRMNFSVM